LARLLGREYGFATLFFWQPMITSKAVKSPDERRFEADYTRDVVRRRELYGAILAERRRHPELTGAADAADLSALFDEVAEPLYIDAYHVSEDGNAAIAEAMLPHVLNVAAAGDRAA
jgi:hypothetical protein